MFYKAGEFARLIGITSVTLRKWDERGWLKPHHRSPSGYRYYSEEQLQNYLRGGDNDERSREIQGDV